MHSKPSLPWYDDAETLVVETPEQVRLELRLAPFASRMLAALFDRLVIGGMLFVVVVFLWLSEGTDLLAHDFAGVAAAVAYVVYFLVSLLYFVVAEVRGEGTTIGKRRLGLRTVHETGRGIDVGTSLVRNLARLVDEIPLAWLVPALARGRRRIGDLLAGTYVIEQARGVEARRRDWLSRLAPTYDQLEDKRFALSPSVFARLHPEDLNLIEYAGQRLAETSTARRRNLLARELARRYVGRLGLDDREREILADPVRFLQELGLALRQRFDRAERG